MRKRRGVRVLAILFSIVLIMTSLNITGFTAKAAGETDPSRIGQTSANVTAKFTESNVAGNYHEYVIKVNNNLTEDITGWLVKVPVAGTDKVQDWSEWASVIAYRTADCLYIVPNTSKIEGTIGRGQSIGNEDTEGNFKFCYEASSGISSSTVYFVTGSKSQSDFNSVIENATAPTEPSGGGGAGGGGSVGPATYLPNSTTELNNAGVEYNYAKLLQESLYFYDANMCGDVEGVCALNWRKNCHSVDKTANYKGKTVDVSGGFHDAGDFIKFGITEGYAAYMLGMSYYEFGDAFDELGQTEHLKTITDYFCDYFVRCTVIENDKAVAFAYWVGDSADHKYWGYPENQTTSRPVQFADSSNPGTDVVSSAAAALTLNFMNFGESKYLEYAKKLFEMAKTNSKTVTPCMLSDGGGYGSGNCYDEYCLAAALLYKATNDSSYLSEYTANKGKMNSGALPSWENADVYARYYGDEGATALANNITECIGKDSLSKVDNGYYYWDQWGSARYNCNVQLAGLLYDKETKKGYYTDWATGQMKFLLGNNSYSQNFIVGYSEFSPKYPHHRAVGYPGWPNDYQYTKPNYVLLGALVGGIGDNKEYHDNANDYICNEVAIDYNAGLVGSAAALYLAHKDDGTVASSLATKTELEAFGVNTYYGEAGGGSTPSKLNQTLTATVSPASIKVGETAQITASGEGAITYSSNTPEIATVSSTGTVTAIKAGTAYIKVTAAGNERYKSATKTIIVNVVNPNGGDTPGGGSSGGDNPGGGGASGGGNSGGQTPDPNNTLYKVSFDPQDGTVKSTTKSLKKGDAYGELPVPEKLGFEFAGWYTAKNGGSLVEADTIFNLSSDVTLYADYDPITLVVGQQYDLTPLFADYIAANPGKYKVAIVKDDGNASVKKKSDKFIVTAKKAGSVKAVLQTKDKKKWVNVQDVSDYEIRIITFKFNRIVLTEGDDPEDIMSNLTLESDIPSALYNNIRFEAKTSKNKPVISVENGEVKPLKKGTASVLLYLERGDFCKKITIKVKVLKAKDI